MKERLPFCGKSRIWAELSIRYRLRSERSRVHCNRPIIPRPHKTDSPTVSARKPAGQMQFAESPRENNRPGRRGKQSCEIFFRRKAVGTSCSDDGIEHRTGFGSFYRRGEQPVLAADRERTDRVLRSVVRDRDVPVLQKAVQIRILVLCILYRG